MTRFALHPEVVGECQLQHAVAVGVLEESTALDAVEVFPPVELVTGCDPEDPLCDEVQSLPDLVFDAGTDGQTHRDAAVLTTMVGYS